MLLKLADEPCCSLHCRLAAHLDGGPLHSAAVIEVALEVCVNIFEWQLLNDRPDVGVLSAENGIDAEGEARQSAAASSA